MEIRNQTYNQDGKTIDCEINHPDLGWIPYTASADENNPLAKEVWKCLAELQVAQPAPIARDIQQKAALQRVDEIHAEYFRKLVNATAEERDTWRVKEDAARAYEAGTATLGQTSLLIAEATARGITEAELSVKIIEKADAHLVHIGEASGLRAKGRADVLAATAESVPLEEVKNKVDEVLHALVASTSVMGMLA